MSDFADNQRIQRAVQQARHFRGNQHPAARQAEHQINLEALFPQVLSELPPRILARCESHKT
jgi:hypothetical protein